MQQRCFIDTALQIEYIFYSYLYFIRRECIASLGAICAICWLNVKSYLWLTIARLKHLKKKFVLWCFDKYLVMNSDEH